MTDNNTVIALFTAATLALTSPRARAQPRDAPIPPDEPSSRSRHSEPFGTQGQWVLGLEDLFLIRHTAREAEYEETQGDLTASQRTTWDETAVQTFWPSVAVDVFPVPALSAGLSARYVFTHTKNANDVRLESNGETQIMNQRGTSSIHELTLSPRVGYAFSLSDELALWARLSATNHLRLIRTSYADGGTVGSLFLDNSIVDRLYLFGAQVSVLGTYSPAPYLTFFAGPAVEKELFGAAAGPFSQSNMSNSLATVISFGFGAAARL